MKKKTVKKKSASIVDEISAAQTADHMHSELKDFCHKNNFNLISIIEPSNAIEQCGTIAIVGEQKTLAALLSRLSFIANQQIFGRGSQ